MRSSQCEQVSKIKEEMKTVSSIKQCQNKVRQDARIYSEIPIIETPVLSKDYEKLGFMGTLYLSF